VYKPEDVRELDRIAIEEQGIPGYELMQRAGQATCMAIIERYPAARRWLVLCGAGNNAGDGYVIARLGRERGVAVELLALADPAGLQGDAAQAWKDFAATGGTFVRWQSGSQLPATDVIVDALFGTGLARPIEGAYLDVVRKIAATGSRVVAVDIPSGLSGLTGHVMGAAIRADITVSFVGLKQGMFLAHGPEYCGDIVFASLGIQAISTERVKPTLRVFTRDDFRELMPSRARTGHKGNYGHVLIVGGNIGMAGAARLAGEAALRSGAGLVSVATRAANVAAIVEGRPELMCKGIEDAADIDALLTRATVIAVGPGLGQDDWAQQIFQRVLAADKPLVIDADALNLLAETPIRRDNWILTPHPGEAARLLGVATAAIQDDRLGSLARLTNKYCGCVLLKGHGTLISAAHSTGPAWLIRGGNPGMATAGMGDVLTGITAAVYAQAFNSGAAIDRIVAAAAWLHACAGDRAARDGERGLLATDLFAELRACLNS
jgi:NAD(P)H-hydrate epimerase